MARPDAAQGINPFFWRDWTISRWTRDGDTWTHAETVAEAINTPLVRPYCPVGATTGPRVIWHRIEGGYTTYRRWADDYLDWWPRP